MKTAKAVCAAILFACVMVFAGCAQNQASTATQEEEKTFSEGEDTVCKVSYAPCKGELSHYFLAEGDRVAVVAPSGKPSRQKIDDTVEGIKEWGYDPILGDHVCDETYSLEDCLSDLTWALEDDSIKAVFCVCGGYGATEVQDALALDLIRSAEKLVIGYSDITVFHSAWTVAQQPSVHASMYAAFQDLPKPCVEAEQKILRGEIPSYTCEGSELCREGKATGILIGGNLSTFTAILGTTYDCTKTEQPYILFLEDVGEDARHIHRCLTILKHLGVLDKAAGIVFGEWTDIPPITGSYDGSSRGEKFSSISAMISRQFLQGITTPVAFGFPAGHGNANYPLLFGATAQLEVSKKSVALSWV